MKTPAGKVVNVFLSKHNWNICDVTQIDYIIFIEKSNEHWEVGVTSLNPKEYCYLNLAFRDRVVMARSNPDIWGTEIETWEELPIAVGSHIIQITEKINYKIGDVVVNHKYKSVGIIRSVFDRGDVRTDVDGVVNEKDLGMYDAAIHFNYYTAPSTRKELNL